MLMAASVGGLLSVVTCPPLRRRRRRSQHACESAGYTALMYASSCGHDLCARALLEAGADINYKPPNGPTALMMACQNVHEQCTRALLEAGAAL